MLILDAACQFVSFICPHYRVPLDYATELQLLMGAYTLHLAVVDTLHNFCFYCQTVNANIREIL